MELIFFENVSSQYLSGHFEKYSSVALDIKFSYLWGIPMKRNKSNKQKVNWQTKQKKPIIDTFESKIPIFLTSCLLDECDDILCFSFKHCIHPSIFNIFWGSLLFHIYSFFLTVFWFLNLDLRTYFVSMTFSNIGTSSSSKCLRETLVSKFNKVLLFWLADPL